MLTQSSVPVARARLSPAAYRSGPRSLPNLIGLVDGMGATMPFVRNAEIYGEAEPADYVYKVVTGAVRTYRILSDGRRQIGAFYLPGDMFGLEAGDMRHFSAEAITNSTIRIVKRNALLSLAVSEPARARELWTLIARELERMQDHAVLLIKSAQERVASFLLELSQRLSASEIVELPMSRHDIADYLGLTIETVSRTLAQLEGDATIALPSARRVVLRNRVALRRLNA
jgi:CRP/FNR family transcriptional regulator, nitrogen fixation regulation protein